MKTIPFGYPIIGDEEKKAVLKVLEGPILVHGPRAKEFEKIFSEFTGANYAVSVSSCTAAMHLFYFSIGLGPGNEVIVPAQTHTATAHVVELCGAKPVFVDAEIETGNINIEQIESSLNENTKAISVVHYLGMPVNMEKINEIARKHKLFVVEDCALALGSYLKGIHAGRYGNVGCFSFYPVKHITTAEGGMLITADEKIFDRITRQKAFGVDRHMGEREIPGVYDVKMLGFNYRMSEIQAALGIEQMNRIKSFLQIRKDNYQILTKSINDMDEFTQFQSSHGDYLSSYYCFSAMLKEKFVPKRLEIVNCLKRNGVGTSVYYPKPVPHFSYYREKYGYDENSFPVAAKISRSSIALPVGPHLGPEEMKYIVQSLKSAIAEVK